MSLKDKEIDVETTLSLEGLAQMMGALKRDVIVAFVKRVDAYADDVEVTKELRDHFIAEVDREEGIESADIDGDWESPSA